MCSRIPEIRGQTTADRRALIPRGALGCNPPRGAWTFRRGADKMLIIITLRMGGCVRAQRRKIFVNYRQGIAMTSFLLFCLNPSAAGRPLGPATRRVAR